MPDAPSRAKGGPPTSMHHTPCPVPSASPRACHARASPVRLARSCRPPRPSSALHPAPSPSRLSTSPICSAAAPPHPLPTPRPLQSRAKTLLCSERHRRRREVLTVEHPFPAPSSPKRAHHPLPQLSLALTSTTSATLAVGPPPEQAAAAAAHSSAPPPAISRPPPTSTPSSNRSVVSS